MRTTRLRLTGTLSLFLLAVFIVAATSRPANAAEPAVGMGNAGSFVVLAGTTVTNTGPSVIGGDLGVSPGTAVTGFGPGLVNNGSIHAADDEAAAAQAALTTAYDSAAGRSTTVTVSADLAGQTLVGGVYTGATLALNGTVTLDAENVLDTVWIFQAASTLITGSSSTVALINGANPCNVFWQVGSSATIGTTTTFAGTVMALTSISAQTGATVEGRLLARNGAVTLDTNVISTPSCTPRGTTTTSPPDTTPTTVAITTPTTAATGGITTTTLEVTSTTVGETTTTVAPGGTSTTVATGGLPVEVTTTTAETSTVQQTPTSTAGPDATTTTALQVPRLTGAPAPASPGGPDRPTTPGIPAAPGTPATPGTPSTPNSPELPRTGGNLAVAAALGALALLTGMGLVQRSRRGEDGDSTPPTPAW